MAEQAQGGGRDEKIHALAGTWRSPVTPGLIGATLRLSSPRFDGAGRRLIWLEGRGARSLPVCAGLTGDGPRDLGDGLNVRGRVGYGGGDHAVTGDAVLCAAEGRLWRQALAEGGGAPRPITPAFGDSASPAPSPDLRFIAFVHSYEGADCLAIVDAEGLLWPRRLALGSDFYMQPAWSPDGGRLAWVEWDHPNMPWEGTRLVLADLDRTGELPRVREQRTIAGGPEVSAVQPRFSPDGRHLAYLSDATGFSHVYLHDLSGGEAQRLTEGPFEHARPAWVQGQSRLAFRADGRALHVLRSQRGADRLVTIDLASGEESVHEPLLGYTALDDLCAAPAGGAVALIGAASARTPRVLLVEPGRGGARVLRRAGSESLEPEGLSIPKAVEWKADDGATVHGLFYPPASARFTSNDPAPLVVVVHGGPTSQATATWSPTAQFLATRGLAVLEVNHRGSSGYGRSYMLALRGTWGEVDVEDAIGGARHLAERGLVHPSKRAIMGGSAGGYTALMALIREPDFFSAAVVRYGVTNLFSLAAETHKFEQHYLDALVGPLPAAAGRYRERSPVFHAERIRRPVLILQGTEDKVVPQGQSDAIAASLRARGIPCRYELYEGEGHGFRRPKTLERAWEATHAFLLEHLVYG